MTEALSAWPPKEGLGTVAVPTKEAHFATYCSLQVNAPASKVFEIVCNAGEYSKWNSWIPEVEIIGQPEGTSPSSKILELGTQFIFKVIMDEKKPNNKTDTKLIICDVSTPENPSTAYVTEEILQKDPSFTKDLSKLYRIGWKTDGGFVSMGLMAERYHEIIIISENQCEVRTWEAQGNFLARTVKFLYHKTLQIKFQKWTDDLKKYSEEQTT